MYFGGMGMFLPSARGVELDVHCDDDRWSHLGSTKSRHELQRHLLFLSVETLPIRHWTLRSLRSVPALEWVLGIRSLFQTIWLYHLQRWIWIMHPFAYEYEDKMSEASKFSNSPRSKIKVSSFQIPLAISSHPGLLSEYRLSKLLPRLAHSQERYLLILSCQVDKVLINLALKSGDIQPLLHKVSLVLWLVLQIVFHTVFSHLQRGLRHFADSNSAP